MTKSKTKAETEKTAAVTDKTARKTLTRHKAALEAVCDALETVSGVAPDDVRRKVAAARAAVDTL